MSERRKFTDYEKKTVYAKYNGKCAICGKPVKYKKLTIDHNIPLSKGGTNEMSNLQLACRECNLMKSGLNTQEFTRKVREIAVRDLLFHMKHMFSKGGAL